MRSFPKIKICGITGSKDAKLAAELGADFLGLITYRKSPRAVTQASAKDIVESTPATVQFVLVFVNEDVDNVIARARRLRCSLVQLHGRYTGGDVNRIQKAGLRVICAFQISGAPDLRKAKSSRADLVLLDTKDMVDSKVYGGTGKPFDWELLKRKVDRPHNLIVAGGLSVENFGAVVRIAEPLVLDFNSGVETAPGIKSAVKLKRLFGSLSKARQKWSRL
jgi:phosphoribosylanthranilate isomerase